jgi:hypothetical protein
MYPALFTSLLFLGFLGFHFIYRHYFSKLILIVAFINVLLWLPAISTNTFKWLLLKQTNLFINFTQNNVNHFDLYLLIFY